MSKKKSTGNPLFPDSGLVIEGADGFFDVEEGEEAQNILASPEQAPVEEESGDDGAQGAITNEDREFISVSGRDDRHDASAGWGGKPRIGEQLVSMGIITTDQLNTALEEKKNSGKLLGEVLVGLGFMSADILETFLAETSGFEVFDPSQMFVDKGALSLIDKQTCQYHQVLPVSVTDGEFRLAMADPYDVVALDTLRRFLPKGTVFTPLLTTPAILNESIDAAYGYASSINEILKELEEGNKENLDTRALSEERAYAHPVVRLVNALVFEAVNLGASDIHFEPEENFVRLRYRVDGVLFTAQILHIQYWGAILERIKRMAGLDVADSVTAQKGRIEMKVGGRHVDFRVSSLPTVHGENMVLRVLDRQSGVMALRKLGLGEHNLKRIKEAQERPEGLTIVTGPRGSGRTTTLYSMLREINSVDVSIQTLEDPIEYYLPMIRQTALKQGSIGFADGLQAILGQDPNVILIGELEDPETAKMALQAAMSGDRVYTTLQTKDCFGALPRLFDLGLAPGMLAGNITALIAQRLVRCLCPECREACTPEPAERKILQEGIKGQEIEIDKVFRARQGGCDQCGGQGYKGRTCIAETLLFDEDLDKIVAEGGTALALKAAAREKGFKSLRCDGILKVLEGVTDLEALSKIVEIHK
ncbi:MAG: Flp pilus assembly complex ATPase component TadA [Rhodospirillales bacterium]|nr:Flp pilus assembly complex ATPase component TadA [Alphaproteobacteria bacterium]USO03092.1 MAG: Flp pilus assembly complex ATPase component TadA [Rhodospirillales bacterium]